MTARTYLFLLGALMILACTDFAIGKERLTRPRASLPHATDQGQPIEKLNVPSETRTQLEKLARKVRKQPPPQTLVFAGPRQKEKLEAAAALALELQRPLVKIDIRRVVSRYIGETEKNIDSFFRRAKAQKAILFFDEADALFGKRTAVTDAHDRYANQEVSYLLQRVREHTGLMIFSTQDTSGIQKVRITEHQTIVSIP